MTELAEKIRSEMMSLSPQDRAELAYLLLQSLEGDGESEPEVERAWDAELARRAEEIRSGKVVGKPAAQVFAELREKRS